MTGLVRKATLILSVCGLLAASSAMAAVPDPGNSSFNKAGLNLVGHDGSTPDGFSPFTVNVEDIAGNPIMGSIVVVDFSGCSDIQFCEDQLGNSTADCPTRTVRKATDVNGDATFTIIGGADIAGDPDGSDCNCAVIYADGVNIVESGDEPINVGTFNLDNSGSVGGPDLSLWLADFGSGLGQPRADYDHSHDSACSDPGAVGGPDLSIWLGDFGGGGSALSCADLAANKCTP